MTLNTKFALAGATLCLGIAPPDQARAGPEWHAGLEPGIALDVPDGDARWAFRGAATAELLFGRSASGEFGWGPGVEVSTWAFSDARFAALGLAVIPLGDMNLQVSAGPQLQLRPEAETALSGRALLGYRPYNYSASYGTAFGLVAGVDQPLGGSSPAFALGLHLDAMWLSLPALAFVSWLRGTPD